MELISAQDWYMYLRGLEQWINSYSFYTALRSSDLSRQPRMGELLAGGIPGQMSTSWPGIRLDRGIRTVGGFIGPG